MIWVAGRIVRDDELSVSVLDRTFEHGLGLFETLRTWNGKAVLLDRHLGRMRNSASALGLSLDPISLPNEQAVSWLLDAEQIDGDAMLRIVASGGLSVASNSVVWMRALPLPPPLAHHHGAQICLGDWPVFHNDPLARHKALSYWTRRLAYDRARSMGFDESLSMASYWTCWEGSRTNLFMIEGDSLVTPSTKGPIVPGVMRAFLLECAAEIPLNVVQTEELTHERLRDAHEVFLTNSVRGIIPVASAHYLGRGNEPTTRWSAPSPWTQRLTLLLADRLDAHGGPTV